MIKQEVMKPGKVLTMAFWLHHTLHFSGFHGFLLNFDFRSQTIAVQSFESDQVWRYK